MKAVFIFNQLNDIVFMHYDEGFRRHVMAKATEAGLAKETDTGGPLDPNVAMQLFAMVVTSQRFMTEQVDNPYQSIRCENGFLFVMEQYHNQILMAINGDKLEKEDFMRRKLLVLQKILRFFFGPCDEEVRRNKLNERDTRWRFIAQLLDAWVELYNAEQSFLVEAVERLHVNHLLNAKCIQLLERVLSTVRTKGGEKGAVHALITVNSKLLALFSVKTAYELLPSDLLLLIVLTRTQFPVKQRLEDFFSKSVAVSAGEPETLPAPLESDVFLSTHDEREDTEDSEDLEYYSSVPSTPARSPERDPSPQNEPAASQKGYAAPRIDPKEILTRVKKVLHDATEDTDTLLKMFYPALAGDQGGGGPRGAGWTGRERDRGGAGQFTVMLGTPVCKYTPHYVHCIEFMPGITLIILAEVSRTKLSGTICQTVSVLRAVLHKASLGNLQGKQTMDFIDSNLKRILEMVKRVKGGDHIDRLTDDIWKKWNLSKRSGLLAYLDSSDNAEITCRLEATLSSMLDRLKGLFRALYLSSRYLSLEAQLVLSRAVDYCKALMTRHLYDYKEYLAVKSQRNITMTNYVEDFPGLVHFIYVDRSMHQMTAPSINVVRDPGPGKVDMMAIIKAKLWSKIPDIQSRLKKGHLTQVVRDGDFVYSYFLWFEDGSGHPVQSSVPYDGVQESIMPGVLAGGFYRQVTRQIFPTGPLHGAVRGYELFMLHVGVLPTHFVLRQGRKLAALMWETTGEANSPVTLL